MAGDGTEAVERRAAGGFTVVSQREMTLATSKYSSGDWEPGGSPATLNGLALTYNQPITVPMRTKGGREATFVLTVGGERTKVKVQGSACQGFTADWCSGYSPERGIAGMRIACAGEGFAIRGTAQF